MARRENIYTPPENKLAQLITIAMERKRF